MVVQVRGSSQGEIATRKSVGFADGGLDVHSTKQLPHQCAAENVSTSGGIAPFEGPFDRDAARSDRTARGG
jgi:hypothetical protein